MNTVLLSYSWMLTVADRPETSQQGHTRVLTVMTMLTPDHPNEFLIDPAQLFYIVPQYCQISMTIYQMPQQ